MNSALSRQAGVPNLWPQEKEFFDKEEIYEVQFLDISQKLLRNNITLFLKISEAGESKGREELIFCKICLSY